MLLWCFCASITVDDTWCLVLQDSRAAVMTLERKTGGLGFRGPGAEPTVIGGARHLLQKPPCLHKTRVSRKTLALVSGLTSLLFSIHRREWRGEQCLSQAHLLLPSEGGASGLKAPLERFCYLTGQALESQLGDMIIWGLFCAEALRCALWCAPWYLCSDVPGRPHRWGSGLMIHNSINLGRTWKVRQEGKHSFCLRLPQKWASQASLIFLLLHHWPQLLGSASSL